MEFSGQYLTYNEYRLLGGTLEQTPFNILEFEARKEIDKRTFGRLKGLAKQLQETKMCTLELINLQISINNGVDFSGNAINYNQDQVDNAKKSVVVKFLMNCKLEDGTPYLYCGEK